MFFENCTEVENTTINPNLRDIVKIMDILRKMASDYSHEGLNKLLKEGLGGSIEKQLPL